MLSEEKLWRNSWVNCPRRIISVLVAIRWLIRLIFWILHEFPLENRERVRQHVNACSYHRIIANLDYEQLVQGICRNHRSVIDCKNDELWNLKTYQFPFAIHSDQLIMVNYCGWRHQKVKQMKWQMINVSCIVSIAQSSVASLIHCNLCCIVSVAQSSVVSIIHCDVSCIVH